jgi:hypothetical protein
MRPFWIFRAPHFRASVSDFYRNEATLVVLRVCADRTDGTRCELSDEDGLSMPTLRPSLVGCSKIERAVPGAILAAIFSR